MKHNHLIVGSLLLLLNGTLAWTFGQTSLTPAQTTAQLPNRSAAAKRITHERYAFLKWFRSRNPGFYLTETEQHFDALLFPVGRSDRAYALELLSTDPRSGRFYYRASCYQRKEGRYHLVYRVKLEDPNKIVTKNRPAKKIARLETLLDDLPVKGTISKFARSDLAAKRDYVEYGVSLGEEGLYVSLFPANQGIVSGVFTTKDQYSMGYDPYTKVDLEDDQFYQKYGLPVAKAELPLLK